MFRNLIYPRARVIEKAELRKKIIDVWIQSAGIDL
jgi:hypothetical protein